MKTFSKTLNDSLKTKTASGDGSYCSYVQYCQYRGIKLLYSTYDTIEQAMECDQFNEAQKEVELLNIARERNLPVPKCYGVRIVLINGFYQIRITNLSYH
jgi:hypothetical protein